MGTRLYKRLGYGFATPIGEDAPDSVPNILNPDSFLLDNPLPFASKQEAWADYIAFATKWAAERERTYLQDPHWLQQDGTDHLERTSPDRVIAQSIEDFEHDRDVVMVTPLWLSKDWSRFDDTIDYLEHYTIARNYSLADEVVVLKDGIYPFSGSYIRTDTMEPLAHGIMNWIRERNAGKDGEGYLQEMFAEDAGFESHEQALSLVQPAPAPDAVVMALWGKLFTDDSYAYRMHPIYYKYWR